MNTVKHTARLALILLAYSSSTLAGEIEEVRRLAPKYGGRTEVRLPSGARVDLLTPTHAIEVDWATHKVYEAVGQSLYYSIETGKKPGIILLVRSSRLENRSPSEQRYIDKCRKVCNRYHIALWIEPTRPYFRRRRYR